MRNIVDVSAFTDPISVIENGDPAIAENFDPAYQGLANRTKYLKEVHDTLEAEVDAHFGSGGTVVFPAPVAFIARVGAKSAHIDHPDSWLSLNSLGYAWRSQVPTATLWWDLTPHLKTASRILKVSILVKPGIARPTTGDRMQFELERLSEGVYPVAPAAPTMTILGTATDDGTGNTQWVVFDFSGAPLNTFSQHAWGLRLVTGATSGVAADPDEVYLVRIDGDTLGHSLA